MGCVNGLGKSAAACLLGQTSFLRRRKNHVLALAFTACHYYSGDFIHPHLGSPCHVPREN